MIDRPSLNPSLKVMAAPYPYYLPLGHTALMMIDMQRDFILPGGFGDSLGNDVTRLVATIPIARHLLDWSRQHDLMVIHTKEAHAPDLSDCPPAKWQRGHPKLHIGDAGPMGRVLIHGEEGSDFVPELSPLDGEIVIVKPGKGAFYKTDLNDLLQRSGVTHLLMAGVTTEVCVQTSMREANDRGYECLLVEDATESYFPAFKEATLAMIRAQGGIVGWTAPLQALIDARVATPS